LIKAINMHTNKEYRNRAALSKRVVVKIGSRVLVQRSGRPDLQRIKALVKDIARLRRGGREVIVVSSGAIGAGIEALGRRTRPDNLPELQMAAAVGQTRLMSRYEKLFAAEKFKIAQVLLTHDDLRHRSRHLNARNTILTLLRNNIIPIVNENDAVAVDEIKFGDNDILASLVSLLVDAELLILLSTVDGLRRPVASGRTRRVPHLEGITSGVLKLARDRESVFTVGGMASKLEAARMVVDMGTLAIIANGRKTGVLQRIVDGDDVGTVIGLPRTLEKPALASRKKWIAFFNKASGTLTIDDGAALALEKKGKSLLPIGIKEVQGEFEVGSVVNVRSESGALVARGLTEYASRDVRKIKGHRTSEIASLLGAKDFDEVIHRDHMVILKDQQGK